MDRRTYRSEVTTARGHRGIVKGPVRAWQLMAEERAKVEAIIDAVADVFGRYEQQEFDDGA